MGGRDRCVSEGNRGRMYLWHFSPLSSENEAKCSVITSLKQVSRVGQVPWGSKTWECGLCSEEPPLSSYTRNSHGALFTFVAEWFVAQLLTWRVFIVPCLFFCIISYLSPSSLIWQHLYWYNMLKSVVASNRYMGNSFQQTKESLIDLLILL